MAGSQAVIAKMWSWATLKRAGCEAVSLVASSNAVNYAKTNYRWQPRTGYAHGSIHGGFFWESPTVLKAYVAHSAEYGIYLELANDRHYAILEEAISEVQDSWFNGIKKVMDH